MDAIDLHRFTEDLAKVPPKGSNQPPRSISAAALDGNFNKVTVLPSETDPPEYQVSYGEGGIILSEFLPQGQQGGDILYWDGEAWVVLAAPTDDTLRVLTIQSGTLTWLATEDC
jgi:hypothetical protein